MMGKGNNKGKNGAQKSMTGKEKKKFQKGWGETEKGGVTGGKEEKKKKVGGWVVLDHIEEKVKKERS